MKFTEFKIRNFKGIEDVTFNLSKSPDANIYTLVGLNESGKTTILEAINMFTPKTPGIDTLELTGSALSDYSLIIPISKRDNFNDSVALDVTLSLTGDDFRKIESYAQDHARVKKLKSFNQMKYHLRYKFQDSKFQELDSRWTGLAGIPKNSRSNNFVNLHSPGKYADMNSTMYQFCKTLIPSILYFPNFLFDFPSRIYLEEQGEEPEKERFYIELVQDILYSLENEATIEVHLLNRIRSQAADDRRNLNSLLQKMSRKVSDVIYEAWKRIFKKQIQDSRAVISANLDEKNRAYIAIDIEQDDGVYQINERSLGFRWFFTFLLFTQFRPHRKNTPENVIFLFDEPASNLHSYAQKHLLKSFENLTRNSKVIYTTHSHHMINPDWLESTFVVKNVGLNLEDTDNYNIRKTNINIEPYREFVVNHPRNTAYFQPILDVLEYTPSDLEAMPNCAFTETR
jgi:predicted ATP-dependent endonuclease of OLD family